jgi:sec-independent protein translocase protein TatA
MFDLLEPTHLLFVFLVALVVFGPKRLVEMSRSLGQTIQSIQDYKEELKDELTTTSSENEPEKESPPTTTTTTTTTTTEKKG